MKRNFKSYRVCNSGKSIQEVFGEINATVFQTYGPDYGARGGAMGIVVDPLVKYEQLLEGLAAVEQIEFVTHYELLTNPCPADKIRCALRHDVDIDIRAALSQARIERDYGVRSTWFVLHTSQYYGSFEASRFLRNESLAHIYREIQALGHEIALHTDGLLLYQQWQMDGAEAVRTEIAWLRDQGVEIRGSVAHNSAATYGAENFAIFKGRPLTSNRMSAADRELPEIIKDGRRTLLHVLDEAELGLAYEGNEVFWQTEVPVEYGATRGVNAWRWNQHLKRWRKSQDPRERWFFDQDRMLEEISGIPPGTILVLSVHPVYYGCRHSPHMGPARRLSREVREVNSELGWETYRPLEVQARTLSDGELHEHQVINYANEFGMLDVPPFRVAKGDELRVLILGGRNLDGASVGIPAQFQVLLAELLRAQTVRPVLVAKLAFSGMGVARLFGWYRRARERFRPHVVLLGVGADDGAGSLPEYWSGITGFNAIHPPGDYLRFAGDRVETVSASAGASVRRQKAGWRNAMWSALAPEIGHRDGYDRDDQALAAIWRHAIETIRSDGSTPFLLLSECGESLGYWSQSSSKVKDADAHRRCMQWLSELTQGLDLTLIDPYERFLHEAGRQLSHWRTVNDWSLTGHRLAAAVALETLMECLEGELSGHVHPI